jgi:hypothetical protein
VVPVVASRGLVVRPGRTGRARGTLLRIGRRRLLLRLLGCGPFVLVSSLAAAGVVGVVRVRRRAG